MKQGKQEKDLSASLQHYLAIIHRLQSQNASVRPGSIARLCGVQKPSVTAALRLLADLALVEYEPYYPVKLTEQGKLRAEEIAERCRLIREFLVHDLKVEAPMAEEAALSMQLTIPDSVVEAIAQRVEEREDESTTGRDEEKPHQGE